MHKTALVHVLKRCYGLVHYALYFLLLKQLVRSLPFLHDLVQVVITILKYDVDFVFFLVMDHFTNFYHEIALVQLLEGNNLRHIQAGIPRRILPLHLFDGYNLLIICVNALDHYTVGTLT